MRSCNSSKPAPGPAPAPGTEAMGTGSAAPAFLEIAQIQTAFGVDGEVRARILTDFPRRFARLKKVFLGEECTPYSVEHAKVRGDDVFLKLGGVTTPEEAAKLRLKMVQVPTAEAMPLPKGAYYHYRVIGLSVVSVDGQALGRGWRSCPPAAMTFTSCAVSRANFWCRPSARWFSRLTWQQAA